MYLSSAHDISEEDFIRKFEIINHGQRQNFKYQTMENDEFKYNISHDQPEHDGYDLVVHVHGDEGSSEVLYDRNLSLQPELLVFSPTSTLIYITFRDVEYNQIIFIDKQIEYYKLYRINDTLMITNVFDKSFFDRENLLTIVMENFFIWTKLQTLNFKFKNDKLSMTDENLMARNITDLWEQIIVNDEIFF
uniref:Uncharacterized protein n=1 Tax=Romanomermis culicivorax TaxID=13658 RepID=A0A915IHX6_ROMCU